MPALAKVSSIDALDAFRASLIVYLDRARHILDDVQHDVLQTRSWLEDDRLPYWKKQARIRGHELSQAEQELLTARLSGHTEAVRDRRRACERARIRVAEAEEVAGRVRRWILQFDHEVDPRLRAIQPLRHSLDQDLVKAVALLAQTASVLADYAGLSSIGRPGSPPSADSIPEEVPAEKAGPNEGEGGRR